MKIAGINQSFNDAEGISVVIHFQGCSRQPKCKDCFLPDLWDPNGGEEISKEKLFDILMYKDFDWIDCIVFQGGEPLDQEEAIIDIAKWAKEKGKKVWVYTSKEFDEVSNNIKEVADVIKTGPYIKELKTEEKYRGSSNQILWKRINDKWIGDK